MPLSSFFFSWTTKVPWGKTSCDYSQQRKTKELAVPCLDQTTQHINAKVFIRPKGTQ